MAIKALLKKHVPASAWRLFRRFIKKGPSKARRESNAWLRHHASDIKGHVISIGSGSDYDKEGGYYRDYFKNCLSYTTSEVTAELKCDMILDARSMPEIQDESFDCVFCNSVLEHVDNYLAALEEITRILKPGRILLLGLPFRQALHSVPNDYWRFTEYGIRHMLQNDYAILDLAAMDNSVTDFPAIYWVKARRL